MMFLLGLAAGAARAGPTAPVSPLSATQFKETVATEQRPIVVLFYAEWSAHSRSLRATLARVALDYQGQVRFVEMDMNKAASQAASYEISGVPALLLLDHGRALNTRIGETGEEELRGWIDSGLDAVSSSPVADP